MTIADSLAVLESCLPDLKARRTTGPFENDIYEAIDYWCHLGQRALRNDTRVNYPVRAQYESLLLRKLLGTLSARSKQDERQYLPLLERAEEMIRQIEQVPVPPEGHLGVLRTIRNQFAFLFDVYGFKVADEQPSGVRLSSGAVNIEIGWATQSSLSFSLGGDGRHFWVEDLLFLHGDGRWRSVPQSIDLSTEADVESWFGFLSSVLRDYGKELLDGQPDAFARLAEAQSRRDAEYAAMMNATGGQGWSYLPGKPKV